MRIIGVAEGNIIATIITDHIANIIAKSVRPQAIGAACIALMAGLRDLVMAIADISEIASET